MSSQENTVVSSSASGREFLRASGTALAGTALAGVAVPNVHAAEDNTIRVALIGCGGRGTGAAGDALSVSNGPIKLVAMADVFANRLSNSFSALQKTFSDKLDVPEDRKFVGFDAYKKAMDCLKPGDVAIFATPPCFRWVHFRYAVEKGLNVFMEKPVTVDAPTTRTMLALGEQSVQQNLKVGVGLMVRHCRARRALYDRIKDGQIGDIVSMRVTRMQDSWPYPRNPGPMSDLLYQVKRFHGFLWASGGFYSDFNIHQIDECSWMKDAWPISAQAVGGRHYRGNSIDQNFDTYSVEYTYPDGAKLFVYGRTMVGCYGEFSSQALGSKGLAIISTTGHTPGKCCIYSGHEPAKKNLAWAFPQPEASPYRLEWEDLIDAIRQDKPYNEVKRGAEASLVCTMGRMAAHTGRTVTWEEVLQHDHEFAPNVDKLTDDSSAPLLADANGKYPIPQPGIVTKREY